MKLKQKELTTCALFAALIVVGAFIKIDIPLPYVHHAFYITVVFCADGGISARGKTGIA